jgi:hypothetical protein
MTQKFLSDYDGAAGDFILHMESPQKCLTYGQITMPASGQHHALTNVVAYPLITGSRLAISGQEASVVAFLIAGEPFSEKTDNAVTTGPLYTILDNFDGVVLNEDMIPLYDCQDTPIAFVTVAAIVAAAKVLGAKFVDEPEKITEHDS